MSDIRFCHNCGRGLFEGAKFCPYCGARVEEDDDPVSKAAIFEHYDESDFEVQDKAIWEGNIPPSESGSTEYQCLVCRYVHTGPQPPNECPVCHSRKDKFVPFGIQRQNNKNQNGNSSSFESGRTEYQCLVCGYVHTGPQPPKECPVCHSREDKFVPFGLSVSKTEVTCFKCGIRISSMPKYCPKCNAELFITCPKCGNRYSAQYKRCSECGINRDEYIALKKQIKEEIERIERRAREEQRKVSTPHITSFIIQKLTETNKGSSDFCLHVNWHCQNVDHCVLDWANNADYAWESLGSFSSWDSIKIGAITISQKCPTNLNADSILFRLQAFGSNGKMVEMTKTISVI